MSVFLKVKTFLSFSLYICFSNATVLSTMYRSNITLVDSSVFSACFISANTDHLHSLQ